MGPPTGVRYSRSAGLIMPSGRRGGQEVPSVCGRRLPGGPILALRADTSRRFFGRAQPVRKLPFRPSERHTKARPQRPLNCSGLRLRVVCRFYTHSAKVGFDEARPMQWVLIKNIKVGTIMSLSVTIEVLAESTCKAAHSPANPGGRCTPGVRFGVIS
jgi:hypothetical protein